MQEKDWDKAESALFLCNCEDDSSHVEKTYHKHWCKYRKWFEKVFGE